MDIWYLWKSITTCDGEKFDQSLLVYTKCQVSPEQCGSVWWCPVWFSVSAHSWVAGSVPPSGHIQEATDWCFSLTSVLLSLSFPLPSPSLQVKSLKYKVIQEWYFSNTWCCIYIHTHLWYVCINRSIYIQISNIYKCFPGVNSFPNLIFFLHINLHYLFKAYKTSNLDREGDLAVGSWARLPAFQYNH